jgi:hypothetical protein
MDTTLETAADAPHLGPTFSDKVFLLFLVLVLVAVTLLGIKNYQEGLKTETTKETGEAWLAWLSDAAEKRFDDNYPVQACKGGIQAPANALKRPNAQDKQASPALGTWGACYQYLTTQTPLKDLRNPFTGELPQMIAQCSTADISTAGAIVLENLVATPLGSATPYVAKQLVSSDPIDYKMQLRLTVCDKGGDSIKVSEFDF